MSIHAKLSAIQQELRVPKLHVRGDLKYRTAEDILLALKPMLASRMLCVYLSDSIQGVGDRHYVCARCVLTSWGDDKGKDNSILTYGFAREAITRKGLDDAQVTGSASSYARKVALSGMFALDDGIEPNSEPSVDKRNETIDANQEEIIRTLCENTNTDIEKMCESYDAGFIAQLTVRQAEEVLDVLEKRRKMQRSEQPV